MTFKESVEILKKIWKEKKLDQAETEALETAVGFMGKVDAEMEFQAMAWDTQICMYIPIGGLLHQKICAETATKKR